MSHKNQDPNPHYNKLINFLKMFSENENLILAPITADESTSIRDKTSLFNQMSFGLLDQYEVVF